MFVKNSKIDFLTNKMISLWPVYNDRSQVPSDYKDEVTAGSDYHLMILSTDAEGNKGIYAWNGTSWDLYGQANERLPMPSGPFADRPSDPVLGDMYYATDINGNTAQIYTGSEDAWKPFTNGAYAKVGTDYTGRPSQHSKGEIYCMENGGSVVWNDSFWADIAVHARNGEPTLAEGYWSGQMQFRVESGQLYIYTGAQWYRFDGTQVVQ